jgi:hypothetical protein
MLLFIPPHGPAKIRTGHPRDPASKELPAEKWDEGLLGACRR